MKVFGGVVLVVALMCSSTSVAQDFAPVGAKWYYGEGFAFSPNISYLYIESVGDTIVGGRNCRVLINDDGIDCSFHSMLYLVFEEDSSVYFYVPQLDTFQTLFDLKSLPGETWQTVFTTDVTSDLDTVVVLVDSVDFQEINGQILKQLYVTYEIVSGENWGGSHMRYPAIITERLGDMEYMFRLFTNRAICDGNYSLGLRCYDDPVMGLYSTGIAPACDFTGIDDGSMERVSIYPNPTMGFLKVSTAIEHELMVHVIDFIGREVMVRRVRGQQVIDVSYIPNGMYSLRIEREGKLLGVKRFIKTSE